MGSRRQWLVSLQGRARSQALDQLASPKQELIGHTMAAQVSPNAGGCRQGEPWRATKLLVELLETEYWAGRLEIGKLLGF